MKNLLTNFSRFRESARDLDSPERVCSIRNTISQKIGLRKFYQDTYDRIATAVRETPVVGLIIEIGSGGGFSKGIITDTITTDILDYEGVDLVVDAMKLPFADGSAKVIFMVNVFHHISDVGLFLHEANRCLAKGGRLIIVDINYNFLTNFVLKYLHNEDFIPTQKRWAFDSKGPISGANTALPWIVFERDRKVFERTYKNLEIEKQRPYAPLIYWLAGGLKSWTLIYKWNYQLIKNIDRFLLKYLKNSGSFTLSRIRKT